MPYNESSASRAAQRERRVVECGRSASAVHHRAVAPSGRPPRSRCRRGRRSRRRRRRASQAPPGVPARREAARAHAPLHALADGPVLAVDHVPKLGDISRRTTHQRSPRVRKEVAHDRAIVAYRPERTPRHAPRPATAEVRIHNALWRSLVASIGKGPAPSPERPRPSRCGIPPLPALLPPPARNARRRTDRVDGAAVVALVVVLANTFQFAATS